MNKKRLTAFVKMIYKDDDRPALCNALIDRIKGRTCLVGSNGVMMAIVWMDGLDDYVGKQISRIDLEAKAKAMGGRVADVLTVFDIEELVNIGRKVDTEYPNYMSIISPYLDGEPVGQPQMRFNAEFFKQVQDLDGDKFLVVDLYGETKPMVFKSERGIYIVMPMTLKKPGQAS